MGIHSNADSMEALIKLLTHDTDLKNLMMINQADQEDWSLLATKYFQQTFVSNVLMEGEICSLIIRQAPQTDTNNEFVKWNSVIIEIFVHEKLDRIGFKKRTLMISDKLIKMLHRKYIGSDLYKYVDGNELQSGTEGFKRYYVMFKYKCIYA